jgi:hypothetical protein
MAITAHHYRMLIPLLNGRALANTVQANPAAGLCCQALMGGLVVSSLATRQVEGNGPSPCY